MSIQCESIGVNYKGFIDVPSSDSLVNQLHEEGHIDIPELVFPIYQNMYVELTGSEGHTGLARVKGDQLVKFSFPKKSKQIGIKPKNREQVYALDALLDPSISLVVLSGGPGVGKTILAIAGALNGYEKKIYKKIILSKPMTQITKNKMGALPGELSEKFNPYLRNYLSNFQQLMGDHVSINDLAGPLQVEFLPVQMFLGSSFVNTFLVIDEAQGLTKSELGALITRVGEGSKMVILGDLLQLHEPIEPKQQGLRVAINDERFKQAEFVATIELAKCERSPLARLAGEIFEV